MNCDWVRSNITLYAFDELGDADRVELEQHITRCGDCAREAEAEKQLRRIMDLRPKLEPRRCWRSAA
jgi:anti-sigma factor RsiW